MGKYSQYPAYSGSPIATDKVLIYDITAGAEKVIPYSNFTTRPHINLSDPNTKVVSNTAAEYAITYATATDQVLIGFTPGDSKVYAPVTGMYLVAVSALIDTTSATTALFDLWVKVNGQNLADSNTQISIDRAGIQFTLAVTFNLALAAGDYFELFYHANQTNVRILAVPAQTGPPAIPACPSIIVAVSKIGS